MEVIYQKRFVILSYDEVQV